MSLKYLFIARYVDNGKWSVQVKLHCETVAAIYELRMKSTFNVPKQVTVRHVNRWETDDSNDVSFLDLHFTHVSRVNEFHSTRTKSHLPYTENVYMLLTLRAAITYIKSAWNMWTTSNQFLHYEHM